MERETDFCPDTHYVNLQQIISFLYLINKYKSEIINIYLQMAISPYHFALNANLWTSFVFSQIDGLTQFLLESPANIKTEGPT